MGALVLNPPSWCGVFTRLPTGRHFKNTLEATSLPVPPNSHKTLVEAAAEYCTQALEHSWSHTHIYTYTYIIKHWYHVCLLYQMSVLATTIAPESISIHNTTVKVIFKQRKYLSTTCYLSTI